MEEIEERRQFLEEMESLGRGGEYRSRILTEISQRVRELELLDRERSAALGLHEVVTERRTIAETEPSIKED